MYESVVPVDLEDAERKTHIDSSALLGSWKFSKMELWDNAVSHNGTKMPTAAGSPRSPNWKIVNSHFVDDPRTDAHAFSVRLFEYRWRQQRF